MSNELAQLQPPRGSRHGTKRVARGPGSGWGKTAGRGEKGQTSRSGKATGVRVGFEGGQMPLQRRLPKRGFINRFRRPKAIVNVRDLARFPADAIVGPADLAEMGLVQCLSYGVKVLAVGEIGHALTVKAHACSAAAKKKIVAAGGTVEIIGAGSSGLADDKEQLEQ